MKYLDRAILKVTLGCAWGAVYIMEFGVWLKTVSRYEERHPVSPETKAEIAREIREAVLKKLESPESA